MDFPVTIPDQFLFTWESQVSQYPYKGEPGIGYFAGEVEEGTVDCLLYRNEKGNVRGILNHYPFEAHRADGSWEKPGNVNIWVHPKCQGQGIGTALWEEAVRRWGVTVDGQRFTAAGAAFARRLTEREEK